MKKLSFIFSLILAGGIIFSASYTNNTYQKLADEYSKKAQNAFDAGEYQMAVEYSKKASENAALSKAFIDMMKSRGSAEDQIKLAQNKLNWAESINAERNFPMAYTAAKEALENAQSSFEKEDFTAAYDYCFFRRNP